MTSRTGLTYRARLVDGRCPECGGIPRDGGKLCSVCLLKKLCSVRLLKSRLRALREAGLSELEIERARISWAKFIGICDACWRQNSCGRWCFDHDHELLTFRGIIGENCNRAIGMVNEDPEVLRRLEKYLKKALRKPEAIREAK